MPSTRAISLPYRVGTTTRSPTAAALPSGTVQNSVALENSTFTRQTVRPAAAGSAAPSG